MRDPDSHRVPTPYARELLLRDMLARMTPEQAASWHRWDRWYRERTPAEPGGPDEPAAPERAARQPPPRAVAEEAHGPPEMDVARAEFSEVQAERGRRSGEVRRELVSDRDARIVAAREAGMSQREIARREGVSRGAVTKALDRHRAKVASEP